MGMDTADKRKGAILDGEGFDDAALKRIGQVAPDILLLRTKSGGDIAERLRRAVPTVEVSDGGRVEDLRGAMVECAARSIVTLFAEPPVKPERAVAQALQGAAAASGAGMPFIAVAFVRNGRRRGRIGWLSEVGEVSGYGQLVAVSHAASIGAEVVFVSPAVGTSPARTPEAEQRALDVARELGVTVIRISDTSPVNRVIGRFEDIQVAVHPVLDAPGGHSLLRPGELAASSVAGGSPAAVVRLLKEFNGDVVAVFDGVRLTGGTPVAAKAAAAGAATLLGLTAIGAISG